MFPSVKKAHMFKYILSAFLLSISSNMVYSQGLDSLQEKRVHRSEEENPNPKPNNISGLDMQQEQRVQSKKYAPIPDGQPSGGGLDDAEMELRALQKN